MRRVVLDPGVLVSALISPAGSPGKLLIEVHEGAIELIASPLLLEELTDVLRRDKFRCYVDLSVVEEYVALVRRDATMVADPAGPAPLRSVDPKDDYLISLAHSQNATLVSGDKHLLDLAAEGAPVLRPHDLLAAIS